MPLDYRAVFGIHAPVYLLRERHASFYDNISYLSDRVQLLLTFVSSNPWITPAECGRALSVGVGAPPYHSCLPFLIRILEAQDQKALTRGRGHLFFLRQIVLVLSFGT